MSVTVAVTTMSVSEGRGITMTSISAVMRATVSVAVVAVGSRDGVHLLDGGAVRDGHSVAAVMGNRATVRTISFTADECDAGHEGDGES